MKILKIVLSVIFLAFCYLFAVKSDFPRLTVMNKLKITSPLSKDLTYGITLNSLPKKEVKDGLTTYIVFDEEYIEAADMKILEWFNESIGSSGGESLLKMKSEIKLMETAYKNLKEAERLTTDGTPEQKLLKMEIQMIVRLHDTLAKGVNLNLQYGFN